MHLIRVDDEVYALLERSARPFVDTPNATLRRLLGLGQPASDASLTESSREPDEFDAILDEATFGTRRPRARAERVDLAALVRSGAMREGEKLRLVDFAGRKVPGVEARLEGSRLRHGGRSHSMSALARQLLGAEGYRSEAVRGPAHWVNARGESVLAVWRSRATRKPRSR